MNQPSDLWHGTTILTVRKNGLVAIAGDGQVSIAQTIIKSNAKKVRRLGTGHGALGDVIGGFAAPRRTPSRCLSGSKPSSSNIPAS